MTTAVYRSAAPSLSVPQTQNTAPVLEFNCLFTHDLRRKQKRWSDGFLRFHTFNKRVMVYDVPRNYVGDMHWTAVEHVREGDELMLEKGGVMVEVADAIGRTETDLTELNASRRKAGNRHGASPVRAPQTRAMRTTSAAAAKTGTVLKHRSLNALLGTSKGQLGKAALPAKSPFELQHRGVENEDWESGRAFKRHKAESPVPAKIAPAAVYPVGATTPLWARTSDVANRRLVAPSRPEKERRRENATIALANNEPSSEKFLSGFSSDALVPPSSPLKIEQSEKQTKPPEKQAAPPEQQTIPLKEQTALPREETALRKEQTAPTKQQTLPTARCSSPAFQTQQAVKDTNGAACDQRMKAATDGARSVIGDRATAATCDAPDSAIAKRRAAEYHGNKRPPRQGTVSGEALNGRATNKLRTAQSAPKKKMLACQDQLMNQIRSDSVYVSDDDQHLYLAGTTSRHHEGKKRKSHSEIMNERLAMGRNLGTRSESTEVVHRAGLLVKPVGTQQTSVTARFTRSSATEDPIELLSDSELSLHSAPRTESEPQPDTHLKHSVSTPTSTNTGVEIVDEATHASSRRPVHNVHDQDDTTRPAIMMNVPEYEHLTARDVPAPRKKKGIGRKEIRKSAESCFAIQPVALSGDIDVDVAKLQENEGQPCQADVSDGPCFQEGDRISAVAQGAVDCTPDDLKVVPDVIMNDVPLAEDSHALPPSYAPKISKNTTQRPKRVPAAPMRFTPSPQKAAQLTKKQSAPKDSTVTPSVEAAQTTDEVAANTDRSTLKPANPAIRKNASKSARRPVALNTTTKDTAAVLLSRPFQAPKQTVTSTTAGKVAQSGATTSRGLTAVAMTADPWSREAFDLFDWRPPGWDEERWCLKDVAEALGEATKGRG
ncbi:hypothetical protein LTR62_007828 [Meristemomyces frigidus]|uniref:5'-3' DNA helicase ZGRF1-like N-terminal domain-containing protein n=1 Tax=Meristemomyces frigidus TaxID=1508187 RepID=A0AAN7YD89_9PEZI|nr:hypothetical protein LTR62_007828 [Meristemomyces frigidus]